MIIWPGEMEFWERREAAQKQLREERERQAKQEAAWWRFVREGTPSGDFGGSRDGSDASTHAAETEG